MPQTQTTDIHFRNNDGSNSTDATWHTIHYSQAECMKRALIRLGACWAAAGVTLFIPLAHFVLVPGFLIAGPTLAVLTYKTKAIADHADGVCPSCGEGVEVKLEPKDTVPKWTYCPSCNNSLHLDH